jgi:hypothetical protein
MNAKLGVTPELAGAVANWAGLHADAERRRELAPLLQGFHDRAQRLYEVDVVAFEFDFLHPIG